MARFALLVLFLFTVIFAVTLANAPNFDLIRRFLDRHASPSFITLGCATPDIFDVIAEAKGNVTGI